MSFSIIIPIYNVAPYLRECLDSVLAQTYTDWEAICVDDGSTDGSGAILDEYAAKDLRFKVFHQANAGVSAARNAALEVATGDWFLFLDGDDRLRDDALEQLSAFAADDKLDGVLITPYIPHWNGGEVPSRKLETRTLIDDASKEGLILGPYAANGFVVSRLYRRSVFGDLRFRLDMKMAEDVCFWFDALERNGRWRILQVEYYLYRQRPDSVCGMKNPHDCVAILESVLHAFRCIDNGALAVPNAKERYFSRFPWSPYEYLQIAVEKAQVLGNDEWGNIQRKWNSIERQIGYWPFDRKLWLKLLVAPHVVIRPLRRVIDVMWYVKRKVGNVLRFLHLRERVEMTNG